jgi:hypothetical protein
MVLGTKVARDTILILEESNGTQYQSGSFSFVIVENGIFYQSTCLASSTKVPIF